MMEGRDRWRSFYTAISVEEDTKPCLWQEWLGVASVAPELS